MVGETWLLQQLMLNKFLLHYMTISIVEMIPSMHMLQEAHGICTHSLKH